MEIIIGIINSNKRCKFSSSISKSATLNLKGRSAFIFRKSTDYYINPWVYNSWFSNHLFKMNIISSISLKTSSFNRQGLIFVCKKYQIDLWRN